MIYAFRILSPALSNGTPASDMDRNVWTFQDQTLESATSRALRRLEQTFCYASRDRVEATSLDFVGEYPSLQAYRKAEEDGLADTVPAPSASEARAIADDRSDPADEIALKQERAS